MGKDTHALSDPPSAPHLKCSRVMGRRTVIQSNDGVTPTPVISRAILVYNRGRTEHLADGIVITPSHNPPEDGGFKYNPTNGGPADTHVTNWVQDRANELLRAGNSGVKRLPLVTALKARTTHEEDFVLPYGQRPAERHRYGRDSRCRPQARSGPASRRGGALLGANQQIYGLNIEVVNPKVDPTFSFMTVDHDGKIRMDCSSPTRWPDLSVSRINTKLHSRTTPTRIGTASSRPRPG